MLRLVLNGRTWGKLRVLRCILGGGGEGATSGVFASQEV